MKYYKIYTLICILILSLLCVKPSCYAKSDSIELTEALALFDYMGVLDSSPSDEVLPKSVTRGEFAELVSGVLDAERFANGTDYFLDAQGNAHINSLASLSILRGSANGKFNPNELIKYTDALRILIRVNGQEAYLSALGDNSAACVKVAKKVGIITNSFEAKEYLTFGDALIIIANSLNAQMGDISYLEDNRITYSYSSDETPLSVYRDIKRITGVLNDNGITGLYEKSNIGNERIKIGNKIYRCTAKKNTCCVGQDVIAYTKVESDIEKVVCIISNSDDNDILSISADDLIGFSNNILSYYSGTSKKSVYLASDVAVIYNGMAASDGFEKLFKFKVGEVKLYKNSGNNRYNVAEISDYKTGTVAIVDYSSKELYVNIDEEMQLYDFDSDEGNKCIYSVKSGGKLSVEQLSIADIVTVQSSLDNTVVNIYLSLNKITGIVTSISATSQNETIEIDKNKYEISPEYSLKNDGIVPGDTVTVTTDFSGKITHCIKVIKNTDSAYAYLCDAREKSGLETDIRLQMYTDDNVLAVFSLAKKVKFNGESINCKDVLQKIVNPRTKKITRQLIKYGVNKDNCINYIETAATSSSERTTGMLYSVSGGYVSEVYIPNYMLLREKYPLAQNITRVMFVPPDNVTGLDSKYFRAIPFTRESPLKASQTYTFSCYKTDDTMPFIEYVVVQMPIVPEIVGTVTTVVVEGVGKAATDDGDCGVVYGYCNGYYVELFVDSDCDISSIGEGDIISYMTNSQGFVANIRVLYDYDTSEKFWGEKYNGNGCKLADIEKIEYDPSDDARVMITLSYDGIVRDRIALDIEKTKFTIFDKNQKNNKIYIGKITDAITRENTSGAICSKLFASMSDTVYLDFVIYK